MTRPLAVQENHQSPILTGSLINPDCQNGDGDVRLKWLNSKVIVYLAPILYRSLYTQLNQSIRTKDQRHRRSFATNIATF